MPSLATTSYSDLFDYAAQPKALIVCPMCGTDNPSSPQIDRYGYDIGVSRCGCGLAYVNPRMSAEQYVTFYQTAYRPLASRFCRLDTTGPIAHRDSQQRGRVLGRALAARCLPVTALLDVGGGAGIATREIAAALSCASVTIVDPNADDIQAAKGAGCVGIVGTPETLPRPEAHYDLVLSLQTADHWLEPLTALRWMRAACRAGGHLWIDIVDMPAWTQRHPRARPWKIDHPLYWSTASMRRALVRTGWLVQERYTEFNGYGPVFERPSFLCKGV